jgi:uncharacterized membrane protein YdbT with pleckstrin-like domain
MDLEYIQKIDRPHPDQRKLYAIHGVLAAVASCGVGIIALVPLLIRYYTMRYRFDEEGIGVQWGYFFRHESYLTYDKIQDIHLNRGFFERCFELGSIDVQTASGSAGAEITFIGLKQYNEVRDFLYSRMRRGRGLSDLDETLSSGAGSKDESLELLRAIHDEVVALRHHLTQAADGQGGQRS